MPEFSRRLAVFLALLVFATALGCATLRDAGLELPDGGGNGGGLDEATVLAGLKQALAVGSERAVAAASAYDGFWGDPTIRIPLPDQLTEVGSRLRGLGLGRQVDDLEQAMNRAAEQAAGEAVDLLTTAAARLTIEDAFAILRGGDTAATDLFRARTGDALRERFRPIVREHTERVGLGVLYRQVASTYDTLPVRDKPELVDLDAYVTDEALDGLFTVLAREEAAIRRDPAARTTDLLRRVFGG